MASISGIPQAFGRLSEREKRLVLITGVAAVVFVCAIGITATN